MGAQEHPPNSWISGRIRYRYDPKGDVGLVAVQTLGVYHVRQLVQLRQHPAQHLLVVDFDIHVDGGQLLLGVAAAGDAQYVDLSLARMVVMSRSSPLRSLAITRTTSE